MDISKEQTIRITAVNLAITLAAERQAQLTTTVETVLEDAKKIEEYIKIGE